MKRISLLTIFAAVIVLSSCSPSPKPFDSRRWKDGNPSDRGAMVQDILDRKSLIGKPRSDIQDLLGKPDYMQDGWYGYKVVTIPRCHLWECRMDVLFDAVSNRVNSVDVSD